MQTSSTHTALTRAGIGLVPILSLLTGCAASAVESRHYVTTIQPLAFIVRELTAGRAEVYPLLSPKDSPHTYTPLPRDIARTENALALIHVDETLDGWSLQLPARQTIGVFDMTSAHMRLHFESHHDHDHGHSHDGEDPHFWTDPLAVHAVVPKLVEALIEADPEGAAIYRANGETFRQRLIDLDEELRAVLTPVRGGEVVLMHPSLGYMLHRYGLKLAAVIEPSPGKEPSARDIVNLIHDARKAHVKALFTEPQLARRNAEVLAESLAVPLYELDPNGGGPGRDTYETLIRFNAAVLREALT